MTSGAPLHIDLHAAAQAAEPLEISLDDAFFQTLDQQEITGGNVRVTLRVKENAGDLFTVLVTAQGTADTLCDRCLETVTLDIAATDTLRYRYGDDREETSDDVVVLPCSAKKVDIAWDLYSIIEVSMPLQRVHREGECSTDMLRRFQVQEQD